MIEPFQTVLIVASLVLTLLVLVHVALDRPTDRLLIGLSGLLEAALVVQAVIGIVQVASGDHEVAAITFVGYLLGTLLILPAGVIWSLGERSRGGTAALAVAAFTVAFLVLRTVQIWNA